MRRFQLFAILLFVVINLTGQSVVEEFKALSVAEKRWVIFHLRKAKNIHTISVHCKQITNTQCNVYCVDSVRSGGTQDAFRHCFWMARLAQEYSERFCRRLGEAHEKGNFQYYKKHKLEDGLLPDLASMKMDLFNNEVGIQIGKACKTCSDAELVSKIHECIKDGQLLVLNMTESGDYVLENGKIVSPMLIEPLWDNGKTTVSSSCDY